MRTLHFYRDFDGRRAIARSPELRLDSGSHIAVIGGGPAGSFFSYFLLDLAGRVGLDLEVDIYEPRDFHKAGPIGCNMCAGIVSETLIQTLAVDGINLPPDVIQRGMDSYILHNDVGQVRLETPGLEKRIGAIYRGLGPKGVSADTQVSFDSFMLDQAVGKGASHIQKRIEAIERLDQQLLVTPRGEAAEAYDFLAVSTGVNTNALRLFEPLGIAYRPPQVTQTFIREYYLGEDVIQDHFGQTIHFFLLDLPGLHFAAIVPKKSHVTICLLGEGLKQEMFDSFLATPQVKRCMPDDWHAQEYVCHCSPRINLTGAIHPFAERIVFLGDCGISRLYKDGIGAAYRAAKAAATAVVFTGISESDLRDSYGRVSRTMERDNVVGKMIFRGVDLLKPRRIVGYALLQAIEAEQQRPSDKRPVSSIVWDLFTGSASYQDVSIRMVKPTVWGRLLRNLSIALARGVNRWETTG